MTTANGSVSGGAATIWSTNMPSNASWPVKSTSRLSVKYRKKVRSVRPARLAISATVVASKPCSAKSANVVACRRSRAPGCQRAMASSLAMTETDIAV